MLGPAKRTPSRKPLAVTSRTTSEMKNILLTTIITFVLTSCCSDSDFTFTNRHRILLDKYSVNDTIYFKSSSGDLDTFFVAKIDSIQECGIIMAGKRKSISVEIRHLPINHWAGGTELNQNSKPTILNQELIVIEKLFDQKPNNQYYIGISFRDFRGEIESLDNITIDTLLQDMGINKYYLIVNEFPNENDNSVSKIIWTEKYGLTAYFKKSGDLYKLQRK